MCNSLKIKCDPGGARTLDPMIKSHLLYQLSYGVICGYKSNAFCRTDKSFLQVFI